MEGSSWKSGGEEGSEGEGCSVEEGPCSYLHRGAVEEEEVLNHRRSVVWKEGDSGGWVGVCWCEREGE